MMIVRLFIAALTIAACTFAPVPAHAEQGVHGVVMLGPNCPGPAQIGQSCDDRPYATQLAVFRAGRVRPLRYFSSNAAGEFTVSLPPGQYEIRSRHGGLPYCRSDVFVVEAGVFVNVRVSCDTGMR